MKTFKQYLMEADTLISQIVSQFKSDYNEIFWVDDFNDGINIDVKGLLIMDKIINFISKRYGYKLETGTSIRQIYVSRIRKEVIIFRRVK